MNLPRVVSSEEWQAAREMLLAKEKEATRARDALAAERRRLPIVRIDDSAIGDGTPGPLGRKLRDLYLSHVGDQAAGRPERSEVA